MPLCSRQAPINGRTALLPRRRCRASCSRSTSTSTATSATLPAGGVLVVGSGQSGCQIAEELHEAGRDVVLACGRAPWAPRRLGGRDLVWWLVETGFLEAPVDSLPAPEARLFANVLATGHGGGRDLHLRTLQAQGVTLAGHFLGATDGHVRFAPDLSESVAWGDERNRQLMGLWRKLAADRGLDVTIDEPRPFEADAPEAVGRVRARRGHLRGRVPARLQRPGSPGPRHSTSTGSRSTKTARAPSCPGSTSSACTSCASGSRRS